MEIGGSRRLGKTKKRLPSAKPNPDILSFANPKPVHSRHKVDGSTKSGNRSGLPDTDPSLRSQRYEPLPREYKIKEQHRLFTVTLVAPSLTQKTFRIRFSPSGMPSSVRILAFILHGATTSILLALVLLYLAEWTHRDVSAGNIIVIGDGDLARGKLGDLKYLSEGVQRHELQCGSQNGILFISVVAQSHVVIRENRTSCRGRFIVQDSGYPRRSARNMMRTLAYSPPALPSHQQYSTKHLKPVM